MQEEKQRFNPNPTGVGGCKPGETRNPLGRPKGVRYVSELMRDYLKLPRAEVQKIAEDPNRQLAEVMAATQVLLAGSAVDENVDRVLDRTEGKPITAVELSGPDGGAVTVENTGKPSMSVEDFKKAFAEFKSKGKK